MNLKNRLKIAFFTHDIGVFGAARSLASTIEALVQTGKITPPDIYIYYKNSEQPSYLFAKTPNLQAWFLPCTTLGLKASPNSMITSLKLLPKLVLFLLLWNFSYAPHLKANKITHIHLNSLLLWPALLILNKNFRVSIHARELFDKERHPVLSRMITSIIYRRAYKIIAIDNAAAQQFNRSQKTVVITNPINMKAARNLRTKRSRLCTKYSLDPTKQIVSIVGRIEQLKGHEFFLKVAESLQQETGIIFAIIGEAVDKYGNEVLKNVAVYPNVRYLGKIENIENIYAISKAIIRCEDYFPLGRTVWEAYYAGCYVIVPITDDTNPKEISGNKSIITYKARALQEAKATVIKTINSQWPTLSVSDNYVQFADEFWKVIAP